LQTEALSEEDVIRLAIASLAPNLASWYDLHDFCAFDYPYPFRDNVRFRIFVIRHGAASLAMLTPIPPTTPELTYADTPKLN
jgi:hypothetical protein